VQRKATFIRFTLPLIHRANELILRDRDRIIDLSRRTERGWALSPADAAWLVGIAERYGMKKTNIRELLARVDIIPPSLAIAQAAEESGWGTSRFAIEGNALFGQRIYRQGNKGMVPHKRPKGKSFKVRAFAQLIDGVKAYFHNLNSHFAYKKFREQRADLREKKREINGYLLAGTLTRYSERGRDYVDSIRSIMRANALGFLDTGKLWRPELMELIGPDA
jgi:Bax protein